MSTTENSPHEQVAATASPGWSCGICPSPKPASWCRGCAKETGSRETPNHFVDARLESNADVILVAEAPVMPKIGAVDRMHSPFNDDGGQLITRAIEAARKENDAYANLRIAKTYAVLCTNNQGDKEPAKGVVDRCKAFLHTGIQKASMGEKTPVIIAMGMTAVKALGIKASSLKEVQHRVLPGVVIGDKSYTVIVTISSKQLVAMAGMYNTFYGDLRRALSIATDGGTPEQVPLETLTKDYIIPKTVDEVRQVCDLILNYSESGKPPEQWSISVDTETNTKFPHRDSLKVLAVSFAWASGKACAIPLWHPETPYKPEDVIPYIRMVLESKKPKCFHNAKFDLKVFRKLGWPVNNYVWDTMLAEHALEEDKKGLYGLKELCRVFFPEFAGYADYLHEMQEKEEGDSQLENIRKARKKTEDDGLDLLGQPVKKKLTKKQKKQMDGGFEKIPLDVLLPYAAIDTDVTRRLSLNQLKRILEEEKTYHEKKLQMSKDRFKQYPVPQRCKEPQPVKSIVVRGAVPISKVLSKIEFEGVKVDRPYLEDLMGKLDRVIVDNEQELYKMANKGPDELKLNHAGAIANVLFSEGFIHPTTGQRTFYPPVSFTAKGQMQTTEKVMKYLRAKYDCPFSEKKLVYSKAVKARNTFCQNVWDLSSLDGFLHTNYNIHGTATGRLSSNDENMQNIPKKLGGYSIKKIFIPDDDSYVFVNCDAKGAEVKIFAAYAQDEGLIRSLNAGEDTHCFFASKIVEEVRRTSDDPAAVLSDMGLCDEQGQDVYALTYEDFFTREQIKLVNKTYGDKLDKFRTAVKRVVFGILYGAGPKKIAETIGISHEQAQAIIDTLFRLFPSIPAYTERTKWELRTFGCVETYFGRRRRFNVKGATGYLRSRAERQGGNFNIQSTSSEIVLGRIVHTDPVVTREFGGRLLLTVHDSIGFQMPKKYVHQLPDFVEKHLLIKANTLYPWLPVDFTWDHEVGDSYGELMPLEAYLKNLKEEGNAAEEEAYTEEDVRTELADDAG